MFFLMLAPVFFSYILLAAHFFRAGNFFITIVCLIFPLILFFKNRIAAIIVQIGLIIGVIIWINTYINILEIYKKFNIPSQKLTIIFSSIIVFTIFSIFIFYLKPIKKIFFK